MNLELPKLEQVVIEDDHVGRFPGFDRTGDLVELIV